MKSVRERVSFTTTYLCNYKSKFTCEILNLQNKTNWNFWWINEHFAFVKKSFIVLFKCHFDVIHIAVRFFLTIQESQHMIEFGAFGFFRLCIHTRTRVFYVLNSMPTKWAEMLPSRWPVRVARNMNILMEHLQIPNTNREAAGFHDQIKRNK